MVNYDHKRKSSGRRLIPNGSRLQIAFVMLEGLTQSAVMVPGTMLTGVMDE